MKKRPRNTKQEELFRRVVEQFGADETKKMNSGSSIEQIVKWVARKTGSGNISHLTPRQLEVLTEVLMSRDPMHLSDARAICPPPNPTKYVDGTVKMAHLARCAMKKGAPTMSAEVVAAEIQNLFVHKRYLCRFRDKDFYRTKEWRDLRLAVLSARRLCALCGSGPHNGRVLHVDHIKPRSLYPELSFDQGNLQVLCDLCNKTKSNILQASYC